MQSKHYKVILYFIISVIAITFATQIYWTYKNYQSGKQTLINDIQVSLDNAVDRYYSELAQENTFGFFSDSIKLMPNRFPKASQYHSLRTKGLLDTSLIDLDSINLNSLTSITIYDDENDSFKESLTISSNGKDTLIEQYFPFNEQGKDSFWGRTMDTRLSGLLVEKDSTYSAFVSDSLSFNVASFQELTSLQVLYKSLMIIFYKMLRYVRLQNRHIYQEEVFWNSPL